MARYPLRFIAVVLFSMAVAHLWRAADVDSDFNWGQVCFDGCGVAGPRAKGRTRRRRPPLHTSCTVPAPAPLLLLLQLPPWPLYTIGSAIAEWLPRLQARLLPPNLHILLQASAVAHSQALYAAARLGVADALKPGPLHVSHLAAAKGVKEDQLRRVLRALASHGIFKEVRRAGPLLNQQQKHSGGNPHPSLVSLTGWCGGHQPPAFLVTPHPPPHPPPPPPPHTPTPPHPHTPTPPHPHTRCCCCTGGAGRVCQQPWQQRAALRPSQPHQQCGAALGCGAFLPALFVTLLDSPRPRPACSR